MKRFILLIITFVLLTTLSCQGVGGEKGPDVGETPVQITFYEFTSESCGHCQKMKPVIEEFRKSCDSLIGQFETASYQTSEGRELFRKYDISGTPTYIITDSKGIELDRISGVFSLDQMKQFVQNCRKE